MADIEPTEAKASPFSIPRETTPAWESELLLSIGLVVAMLQLSPALDGYFEWWQLRLDERWYMPLMFAFLYSKSAVVALILTFVTHLTARGFWVALVGVRAVFPSGIDWSKVRQGPVAKALAKQRVGDVGAVIERLDNFASLAFAVGFLIVSMTLSAMVVMVLCTLLSGLLAELIFDQNQWWQITTVCLGILFLPLTVALLVDGFLGKRLAPGGRAERLVRMGFRSGAPFFNHPWSEAIMLTLTSGVGALRTALVLNLLLVTGW